MHKAMDHLVQNFECNVAQMHLPCSASGCQVHRSLHCLTVAPCDSHRVPKAIAGAPPLSSWRYREFCYYVMGR